MRGLKRIVGVLTLGLVMAAAGSDVQTVLAAEDLKDASAYTTWNDNNCHDDESLKNQVLLNGEDGEELNTIFKINYTGAQTTEYADGEDLTSYCTNLPDGLSLTKYTSNYSVDYMRVQLSGTAASGTYDVNINIPTSKLVADAGYQIPENGLTVQFYVIVNGEPIPVPAPTPVAPTTQAAAHTHSYEWYTLKAATATEDGKEAHRCSGCGDIEYERPISAYGMWLDSVEKQIRTADENATVEIKTDVWNTYNKDVMNALKDRTDVTLVTTFGAGEDEVTFTIPAGGSTVIVDEATALAASVDEAAGTAATTVEEPEWYGFGFLTGAYAN